MDATSLRYQVSANNLANSEVPNFKRSTVNFESELKRAFESEEKAKNGFQLTRTDSRHISLNEPYDYRNVEPRRILDYATTAKANGNNVDAETEANNILQIQMQYRLLTQLTSFEFSQLNTVMKK
jgi:flagellar basal-body rod protein FlgB